MDYQSRNGEQIGDLILWKDYTTNTFPEPQHYIGLLVGFDPSTDAFVVLCEGKKQSWLAWQCDVLS